jgi:UDP-N-acetylmuramoyl-tripeptide--D-alanyl-D-alanine ligase
MANMICERSFTSFAVDSRQVTPHALFFALPGAKVCGTTFLEGAAANGAKAAVVPSSYVGEAFGLELIYKENPLAYLQELAKAKLEEARATVIGVTGSIGKTSTKDFIYTLLQEHVPVLKTMGNANSQIGLALTLLNQHEPFSIAVLEMGISKCGEMDRHIALYPPEIAVITELSHAHVEAFGSFEGLRHEKMKLAKAPSVKQVICADDPNLFCKIERSGEAWHVFEEGRLVFVTKAHLPDQHLINITLAYAVARLFIDKEAALERLPLLKLPEQRFEKIEREGILFINDSYNASERSMIGALKNLPPAARKIAVFGSMKELGVYSDPLHEEVARVALETIDELYLLGAEAKVMQKVWEEKERIVHWFEDKEALASHLFPRLQKGDLVLLKGAQSHRLGTLLSETP